MAIRACAIVALLAVLSSGCSVFNNELPEALGERKLVDGGCASTEATNTAPCQPSGVRH